MENFIVYFIIVAENVGFIEVAEGVEVAENVGNYDYLYSLDTSCLYSQLVRLLRYYAQAPV